MASHRSATSQVIDASCDELWDLKTSHKFVINYKNENFMRSVFYQLLFSSRFIDSYTSGRLHGEFIRLLLFSQAHRETDRFFYNFRSSACTIDQWRTLPFQASGVPLVVVFESRYHPRQGYNFTC